MTVQILGSNSSLPEQLSAKPQPSWSKPVVDMDKYNTGQTIGDGDPLHQLMREIEEFGGISRVLISHFIVLTIKVISLSELRFQNGHRMAINSSQMNCEKRSR